MVGLADGHLHPDDLEAARRAARSARDRAGHLGATLVTALLGSSYTQIVTFTLVIVALALRPNGLFGRAGVKKV